jgi:hypothetical protein
VLTCCGHRYRTMRSTANGMREVFTIPLPISHRFWNARISCAIWRRWRSPIRRLIAMNYRGALAPVSTNLGFMSRRAHCCNRRPWCAGWRIVCQRM